MIAEYAGGGDSTTQRSQTSKPRHIHTEPVLPQGESDTWESTSRELGRRWAMLICAGMHCPLYSTPVSYRPWRISGHQPCRVSQPCNLMGSIRLALVPYCVGGWKGFPALHCFSVLLALQGEECFPFPDGGPV